MMDSLISYYKKIYSNTITIAFIIIITILFSYSSNSNAASSSAKINQVSFNKKTLNDQNHYYLQLSSVVNLDSVFKEAINQGLPININLEIELYKKHFFGFLNKNIYIGNKKWHIVYFPFLKKFQVVNNSGEKYFNTLEEVLDSFKNISIPILEYTNKDDILRSYNQYSGKIRLFIDREKLPKLIQIDVSKSDFTVFTDWIEFDIQTNL